MTALPRSGRTRDEVLKNLEQLSAGDVDWRQGIQQGCVYWPGDEVAAVAQAAYVKYYSSNALLPREFPSLQQIQADLVGIAAELFNEPTPTGTVTTGGTESNMMAVWGALRRAKRLGRLTDNSTVVAPFSAHPSFDKAAYFYGVRVVRTELTDGWAADVEAMRAAVSDDTVLLVASAPSYAHGIVDPVEEIGRIAAERDLPLHVDAAVGGFMLPFAEKLGRNVPVWDFRVPAVTSITADLHKQGYAPKGVSVLITREEEQLGDLDWGFDAWPGGHYGTHTISGSRSGGTIAGAWAVFQSLGHDGYERLAKESLGLTDSYIAAITEIDAMAVFGEPPMNKFGIHAREISTPAVCDGMEARGWVVMREGPPDGISMHLQPYHRNAFERYVADLAEVCDLVARGEIVDAGRSASYNA